MVNAVKRQSVAGWDSEGRGREGCIHSFFLSSYQPSGEREYEYEYSQYSLLPSSRRLRPDLIESSKQGTDGSQRPFVRCRSEQKAPFDSRAPNVPLAGCNRASAGNRGESWWTNRRSRSRSRSRWWWLSVDVVVRPCPCPSLIRPCDRCVVVNGGRRRRKRGRRGTGDGASPGQAWAGLGVQRPVGGCLI